MFYIKKELAPGVCVKAQIRTDNVFTRCHCCGSEVPVDLAAVFADGEGKPEDTELLCNECADMLLERVRDA